MGCEEKNTWKRTDYVIFLRRPFHDKIKEVNEKARKAGAALIIEAEQYEPRTETFIYVNNRLEGNALETISAMLDYLSG